MVDYSSWLAKAEAITRKVMHLPGQCGVTINIGPTISASQLDDLDRKLPFGLPPPLRDYYQTASANAECRYWWTPDRQAIDLVRRVIPHEWTIYGGPTLCPAADLPQMQNDLFSFAEYMDELEGNGPAAGAVLRGSVPLLAVGNGDYVAVHVKAQKAEPQIIYISHEADTASESPITFLSQTLEQFLIDWERIGFLGTEIGQLSPFLEGSPPVLLDGDSAIASSWRMILKHFGMPIAD